MLLLPNMENHRFWSIPMCFTSEKSLGFMPSSTLKVTRSELLDSHDMGPGQSYAEILGGKPWTSSLKTTQNVVCFGRLYSCQRKTWGMSSIVNTAGKIFWWNTMSLYQLCLASKSWQNCPSRTTTWSMVLAENIAAGSWQLNWLKWLASGVKHVE